MTANQIAYWNYVESNRHNLATEKENTRSNLAREREQNRSNLSQEQISREGNAIRQTSNLINDAHYLRSDSEANRHNLAMERLQDRNVRIAERQVDLGYAGLANQYSIASMGNTLGYSQLAELSKHNRETEATGNRNVSVGRINASANKQNATTRAGELSLKQTQWSDPWAVYQRKYNALNSREQSKLTSAQADYTKVNTIKLGVDAGTNVLNSLSNLMGSAARVVTAGKGYLQ